MSKNIDFSHLKTVNQKYWPHWFFAVRWGCYFIFTGFISIIHGFFPFLWPCKAPENILKTALMIKKNREHYYKDVLKDLKDESIV